MSRTRPNILLLMAVVAVWANSAAGGAHRYAVRTGSSLPALAAALEPRRLAQSALALPAGAGWIDLG